MKKSLPKTEFFNSYFSHLEQSAIKSVILHTYDEYPKEIHSDIDYCVEESALKKLIPLLHKFCVDNGWRLVQIMQHEVKALFCTCVSIANPEEYLQLDVCSDYMREGKFMISSEDLLNERRVYEGKSFYIPSLSAEFIYTFCKGIAKDKSYDEISNRLLELYNQDSGACDAMLAKCTLIKNLDDSGKFNECGESVYMSAKASYKKLPSSFPIKNFIRKVNRVKNPSGMILNCSKKLNAAQNEDFIMGLSRLFRKVAISDRDSELLKDANSVLRTTVVIKEEKKIGIMSMPDKIMKFWLNLEAEETNIAIDEVHQFLESRLVKKWNIKSI